MVKLSYFIKLLNLFEVNILYNFDISIKMLPAKCGDCILIEFDNGQVFLIDSGFVDTYKNHLKKELIKLKENKNCIDLFVVTHIDNDHISGALKLLQENGKTRDQIVDINEIWFNAYIHLYSSLNSKEANEEQKKKINEILFNIQTSKSEKDNSLDAISVKQAMSFEKLIGQNTYSLNDSFLGNQVLFSNNQINFGDVSCQILTPTNNDLNKLSKFWNHELRSLLGKHLDIGINDDIINLHHYVMNNLDNEEILSEQISTLNMSCIENWEKEINTETITPPNKSSISFILNYKNKSLLFLADTEVDNHMVNFIEEKYGKNYVFDIIKLSHHGSYEANKNLINKIKSKNYLISTDGSKYNHPSKKLILEIIQQPFYKQLFFNYDIDVYKILNIDSIKKHYKFNVFCTPTIKI